MNEVIIRRVLRFSISIVAKPAGLIISEPMTVPLHVGLLVAPLSMYFLYFMMPDIFQEGLVYFDVLRNNGAFSPWAFLFLPAGTIALVCLQGFVVKKMRLLLARRITSTIVTDCIISPTAGFISPILFFCYALLFVPLSATWLGLLFYLILALVWTFLLVATRPEPPKIPEFITISRNAGIGLIFVSAFFFFFPNTKDIRNLADVTNNWHYYWFTVGQYFLVAVVIIYGVVVITEIMSRVEWARIRQNGRWPLEFTR